MIHKYVRWLFQTTLVLITWSAAHAAPATPIVIRIAVPDVSTGSLSSSGTSTVDRLYTQKLFEKEFAADGIEVRWSFFKGAGPAINEALVNKQVDFAFLGDLGAIIGKANGADTRLLAASARRINTYLGVVPGKGYDSLEELKGKQIAVWRGTALQLAFNAILTQHGLSEKDFRIISLDPQATNAALAAKRIDAAWGSTGLLALRDRGLVDIPVSSSGHQGYGTLQTALIGDSAFLRAHPDITTRLVKVFVQSAEWTSTPANRDAALKLVSDQANIPVKLLASSLQDEDFKVDFSPLLDDYYVGQFRNGIIAAQQAKLVRKGFDVNAWVDASYLNRALQQLNLTKYWQPQTAVSGLTIKR